VLPTCFAPRHRTEHPMRDKAGNKRHGGRGGGRPRGQAGKHCSFPWINAQIIAASENGGLQELVSTIVIHLPQMNLVNLSTAVHRLAKLTASDPKSQHELRQHPVLEELLQAISSAFGCLDANDAQPQSLSNVAWSLATMRLMNRPLIQIVAAFAVTNISCFKPFELSTMLWAFAKLGTIDADTWCAKPVYHAAATHIMKNVQHFGFRCLATTAWAFATAKQRHARLFRSIAAQMVPMVHAANCQEMANTAWAFGTADFHDERLFLELSENALLRLDDFKPQELSNMLWGFATNGFFHEGFFASSSLVAQRMDLQAQHLANIFWAFARVRPRHSITQGIVLALLPQCIAQLDTFKPQEVSSTALAVAKAFGHGDELDHGSPHAPPPSMPPQVLEFFGAVMPWALPRLREFSAQSLANTLSAYAMVHMPGSDTLFLSIGSEVLTRHESLEPTALLHLLKGFAAVPPEACKGVVQSLAASMMHQVDDLRPQEVQTLSRICMSLLSLRRSQDFSCEELRSCLFKLTVGDGPVHSQWEHFDRDRVPVAACPQALPPDVVPHHGPPMGTIALAHHTHGLPHAPGPVLTKGLPTAPRMLPPNSHLFFPAELGNGVSPGQGGTCGGGGAGGPRASAPRPNWRVCNKPRPQAPQRQLTNAAWRGEEATGHRHLSTINERFIPSLVDTPQFAPVPLANVAHNNDFQWRWSIKNSFLHVEVSDNSDDEPDDSWDGGSSQRSSSVPSRLDHDEVWGPPQDFTRRHTMDMAQQDVSREAGVQQQRMHKTCVSP